MKNKVLVVITPFDIEVRREEFLAALSPKIKHNYDIEFVDASTQFNKLHKIVKCLNCKYHCNVYIYDARYSSVGTNQVIQVLSNKSYKKLYTNATSNALEQISDKICYIKGIKNSVIYDQESKYLLMTKQDGDIYSNDMINYARDDNLIQYRSDFDCSDLSLFINNNFIHFLQVECLSQTFRNATQTAFSISDVVLSNINISRPDFNPKLRLFNLGFELLTQEDELVSIYLHNKNTELYFNASGYYNSGDVYLYDPVLTAAFGINATIY